MDNRILDRPAFRLVGRSARLPLVTSGANVSIASLIESVPERECSELLAVQDSTPAGLLRVSDDVDPDYAEGSDFTFLYGVAVSTAALVPKDFDVIDVPGGTWAIFQTSAT